MSTQTLSRPPLLRDRSLFAVLGISLVLFTLVLVEPLGPDNAVLHSIARDWVRYGRIPYIGSWDNNFPGIMLLHALDILLFGVSGVAFRIFDILIQLAFVGFLYRFLARWLPSHTSALAAVLYSMYYVAGNTYLFGQQDGYGMMLVLVGIALLQGKPRFTLARVIVSAVVTGVSFLMRPTFLLYPGLASLYLLFEPNLRIVWRRIPLALVYFVASLLPMATLLSYYASIPGGLDAFYTSTIRFNLDLYTHLSGGSFWIETARTGLLIPLGVLGIVVALRGRVRVPIARRDALLYLALIAAGLFIVVLMGKYWRYQFAPFFMALIPASAVGIEFVTTRVTRPVPKHYLTVGLLLLCTFVSYNPTAPLGFATGVLKGQNGFAAADRSRRPDTAIGAEVEEQLLHYLRSGNLKQARIEICGFDPYPRLDLQRNCVGPYVSFHAIGFRTDTTRADSFTIYQKAWQHSYVQTLRENAPDVLILNRHSTFWYIHDIYADVLSQCDGFPEFFRGYSLQQTFGGFEVYTRNPQ